ncbi:hypothetical protein D9619_005202 [Psilocybe cf. subviscida]|uniref:Uncharacterized protein n=1 Tax=Psilocybe cf. subviscida TaxID=2480587 RepID=A0A8H5FBK8_9AGAR|nr:hypothetical protein D9619_005202 [Psilocybe cf. subviscida]
MVSSIIRNFALVVVCVTLGTPFYGHSQSLYDDGSLAIRGEGMYGDINARNIYSELDTRDLYDDFDTRDFHNPNQALSVREYIDEQISLALRSYDDTFQELYRRATEAEIKKEIEEWTKEYNDGKKLLRDAVKAERDTGRALDKDPHNKELQKAHWKAGNELHTIRGAYEATEEQLEHLKSLKPSPGPGRTPSPPKDNRHSSSKHH